MKMFKCVVSLLLAMLMALSTMPLTAFAATEQEDISGFYDDDYNDFDLTWSYTAKTDTLYLDAVIVDGSMATLNHNDYLPLYYENENGESVIWDGTYHNVIFGKNVKEVYEHCLGYHAQEGEPISVSFEEGCQIEYIGVNAFDGAHITEIEIPDTVNTIESYAFFESSVEYVKLPNYTGNEEPYLGDYAFTDSKLKRIDFNGFNVDEIPSYAFSGCSLESIELPDSVYRIDSYAFKGCNIGYLKLPDYRGSQKPYLGKMAFSEATINEVDFNGFNVAKIPERAFTQCHIGSIELPDSVYKIELSAFSYAEIDYIKLPDYTGSETPNMSNYVFYSSVIHKIDFSGFNITNIPDNTFNGGTLDCINIPDSVITIDNSAFTKTEINSIYIGKGIKSIGDYAFQYAVFNDFFISDEASDIDIGNSAFSCSSMDYIPSKAKSIGNSAFSSCDNLTSVSLNETGSITNIGNYAFSGCTALKTVSLPEKVTSIGDGAFKGCFKLESVSLDENGSMTSIGDYAFSGCSVLESITLPNEVTAIGVGAFKDCAKLQTIALPNGISAIEPKTFYGCESLETVKLPENLTEISTSAFENCSELRNVHIPMGVTTIGDKAFYKVSGSIYLPNTVETVGNSAFASSGVANVPNSINYFGSNSFEDTLITRVDLSNKENVTIGDYAFSACPWLEEAILEKTKSTTLGMGVFNLCVNLKTISLPNNISSIPQDFLSYTQISKITIPKSVESIGNYAFKACYYLQEVDFENRVANISIGNYAFYQCESLQNITLPNGLISIGKYAFRDTCLTEISIPSSCNSIGACAFYNCPLESATILNKTATIEDSAFFDSKNGYDTFGKIYGYNNSTAHTYALNNKNTFIPLDSAETPTDPESTDNSMNGSWENGTWNVSARTNGTLYIYGKGEITNKPVTDKNKNNFLFAELATKFNVKEVYIGEGITSLPDSFMSLENQVVPIRLVRLPDSLTSIGAHAFDNSAVETFYNASRLSEIQQGVSSSYIPEGVKYIGEYAFANTKGLTAEFELSKNLTEIKEGLFYNSNVMNVSMNGLVTKIGKKAFAECANMTTLYVPISVSEIYTDDDINNNAFGYVNGKVNTQLWVGTRKDSAAYKYCTDAGINAYEHYGQPYRYGYFKDITVGSGSASTKDKIIWEYYIEDNSVILRAADSSYIVESNGASSQFFEYSFDLFEYQRISSLPNAETINISASKLILDKTSEFTAPNLISLFNPEEVTVHNALRKIGPKTFANCTKIKEVYLPMALSEVGDYAFENCTSLKDVRLGYGINDIPVGLFYECRNVEIVDLGNVVLHNIGEKAFYNCNSLKFVNLSNVTSFKDGVVGPYAFYNCVNLQEIVIPENIKSIGTRAFYNCVQAQSIKIGSNVQYIGVDAFANLLYCSDISINSNIVANSYNIFKYSGTYTTGVDVHFEENVSSIDGKLLDGVNVGTIDLGENVVSLNNKEYLTTLKNVTVSENNSKFEAINNCLYTKSKMLFLVPQTLTEFEIAEGTTSLDKMACYATNARSITVPDSVTTIGESCFARSPALMAISLSDNIGIISANAFRECTKLRLIAIPESTYCIQRYAFYGCTNLASVIFNEDLYMIKNYAFSGCSKLMGLAFPEYLSSIENRAFENCASLKYAYIWPETVIGNDSFLNDDLLTIYTMAGSDAYRYARENNIPYSAYTDEELFFDEWAIKIDSLAGYLGYCEEGGHGEIQYLTVYEADCENDGFIIGVCEYCSEILEEIHIDAYGHKYNIEAEIPATETTKGITVYTCENCGQSHSEYTPPLNEEFVAENHTVSGRVVISRNNAATEGIAPAKNVSIVIDAMVVGKTDENGCFNIELETGAYEASLVYPYGFTRKIYIVVDDKDVKYDAPIPIIGCDFNKDGVINDEDLRLFQMVISSKRDDPSYLDFVDMNNDGYINAKDMLYISSCMGLSTSAFKYEAIIIE